jgi:hypothetical protein
VLGQPCHVGKRYPADVISRSQSENVAQIYSPLRPRYLAAIPPMYHLATNPTLAVLLLSLPLQSYAQVYNPYYSGWWWPGRIAAVVIGARLLLFVSVWTLSTVHRPSSTVHRPPSPAHKLTIKILHSRHCRRPPIPGLRNGSASKKTTPKHRSEA